ncbi:LysR substrate-binding domain-containing protein, partial [Burkholderia sola]|uniref:LysR substrate-binding domain-containing protein n=1 Tax=Burkholderia sola TaxID=2843302 RepID=UPI0023DE0323
ALDGTIRLAAPQCFGEVVLPGVLMQIRTAYPKLHIDLVLNDDIVDPVTEGVDISIRVGQLGDGGFVAYALGAVGRVLVAAPSYLERHGPIDTKADLATLEAQRNAARIYNADKTWFVLNGTSTSNKVVTSALLAPDDLVLFDRNNHKSVHLGALVLSGARPVYLETARNAWGLIGGVDSAALGEARIRDAIRDVAPERADLPRPFRLAVIQLGTYD